MEMSFSEIKIGLQFKYGLSFFLGELYAFMVHSSIYKNDW